MGMIETRLKNFSATGAHSTLSPGQRPRNSCYDERAALEARFMNRTFSAGIFEVCHTRGDCPEARNELRRWR